MDQLVQTLSSRNENSSDQTIIEYAGSNTDRLISDWTYAAGTSNHGKYGSYTLALVAVLDTPGLPAEVSTAVARKILEQEVKVIYRALTLMRPAQTVPTLSLLTRFAKVAGMDVFNQFDFTLRIVPKLLSQQPYRQAFLDFYMELIRTCPASVRRELLANRKVFSGWFGKLGLEDDDAFVLQTLDLLQTHVLMDTSIFTKTAKMGLFNDWTLKNMQRMLSHPNLAEALVNKISQFIVILLCDSTFGVRMPGEDRLALSFLKIVKPWENVAQMDLVVKLLKENPDLVVPYFESLATAYPFTPKQSMWWFSYSVLHIRVLKLDPPKFSPLNALSLGNQPKTEQASRAIIPVTLSKTALLQAVSFKESKFIQFQAAQVILFAIRRLKATLSMVYEPRKWDATQLVDEILTTRLPEPQVFAKPQETPLLQTTHLIILKELCQLRPLPLSLPISLGSGQVSGLPLVQAEQLLEIQTLTSDQTRWWTPSKGEASLFTQLLQFATFNPQLADKSSLLLQHLVQPTQLFADMPTLAHPMDALLFRLSVFFQKRGSEESIIWQLLEETIQRVVRSPYQYIDQVRSYYVSPFLVALIEQYSEHFAAKDTDGEVRKWVQSFGQSLVVLGEDKHIVDELLQRIQSSESTREPIADFDEYFDFVLYADNKVVLRRQDIVFKISNSLELAATLYRAATSDVESVRNHLLASIPADLLPGAVENAAAFSPFVNGTSELCQTFLKAVDGNSSENLRVALESSPNWILALPLVSTDFLIEKISSGSDLISSIVKELNVRKYRIPTELLPKLIKFEAVPENLKLWQPGTLGEDTARELMPLVGSDAKLLAAVIRASGIYEKTHTLASNLFVQEAAAKYAPTSLDRNQALQTAVKLLDKNEESAVAAISIFAELGHSTSDSYLDSSELDFIWRSLAEFIEGAKSGQKRSVLLPELVKIAELKPPFISRWLKIAVHQLTKRYAEHSLTEEIMDFVRMFNESSMSNEVWHHVHHNAIDALVEAALRNDNHPETYELISRIALSHSAHPHTQFSSLSHLTTLYETTKPLESTIEVLLTIFALYMSNEESNSTLEVEQGLLVRYNGSLVPEDQIILQLLEKIETYRQRSWVENVESWEVRPASAVQDIDDYGKEPLVSLKSSSSIFVTLDEQRIRHSVLEFETEQLRLPASTDFADLRGIVDKYRATLPSNPSKNYDSRFLLYLEVSCEYLLQNMDVFLSSGLLSFAICALADAELKGTALKLLIHVFNALPTAQFKDQAGTRLLLGKILMLEAELRESDKPLPSHVPGMLGQIALVLARPTHFLHEKVSGWLLSSPKIYAFDVPLFKAILQSSSDTKLRELLWLVNTLRSGLVDRDAVATLTKSGVIEWCLSQYQVLSIKSKTIKEAVARLMNRIEELKGGSITVVTGAGALAVPEFKQRLFYSAGPELRTVADGS